MRASLSAMRRVTAARYEIEPATYQIIDLFRGSGKAQIFSNGRKRNVLK
jgi:hypothetical protein